MCACLFFLCCLLGIEAMTPPMEGSKGRLEGGASPGQLHPRAPAVPSGFMPWAADRRAAATGPRERAGHRWQTRGAHTLPQSVFHTPGAAAEPPVRQCWMPAAIGAYFGTQLTSFCPLSIRGCWFPFHHIFCSLCRNPKGNMCMFLICVEGKKNSQNITGQSVRRGQKNMGIL